MRRHLQTLALSSRWAVLPLVGLLLSCATTESATTAPESAPPSSVAKPAVSMATAQPLLWSIEKAGYPKSTIVASIHILDAGAGLPPAYDEAWKTTESLVLEVDTSSPEVLAMTQELVRQRSFLPPTEKLSALVSPKAFQNTQLKLAKAGVPPSVVDRLRPWSASLMFVALALQDVGFTSDNGVETQLIARAAKEKREITSLESPAEQIDAVSSMDEASAAAALQLLAEMSDEKFETEMQKLMTAWKHGDEAALLEMTTEEANLSAANEAYIEATIFARNVVMVKRIAQVLEDKRTHFVAIGAAHTVGPRSVVAGLRQAGFTVTRADAPRAK